MLYAIKIIEDYAGIRSNLPKLYIRWENKQKTKGYKQVKINAEELKEIKIKVS